MIENGRVEFDSLDCASTHQLKLVILWKRGDEEESTREKKNLQLSTSSQFALKLSKNFSPFHLDCADVHFSNKTLIEPKLKEGLSKLNCFTARNLPVTGTL